MKNQTKKSIKQLKRPTSKNIKVGCFTFFFPQTGVKIAFSFLGIRNENQC